MNEFSLAPTIMACELEAGFCRAQLAPRFPGADKTSSRLRRVATLIFIVGAIALARVASAEIPAPGPEVDKAVIAHLESHAIANPTILTHVDLTMPFATASSWTLVIVQDRTPPQEISDFEKQGPITICFVRNFTPDCFEGLSPHVPNELRWFGTPFYLRDSRVVYAGHGDTRPLLILKTCGARSGDGSCGIATALYDYDRQAGYFSRRSVTLRAPTIIRPHALLRTGRLEGP